MFVACVIKLNLRALCLVSETIVPFKRQVSKTITVQGRTAVFVWGAITDRTRLFHLCASKMVHTRGKLALKCENDKTS